MCSSLRAVRLSTGSMVAQMLLASLLERATGGKGRGELVISSSEVVLIVADMVFRIALSLGGALLREVLDSLLRHPGSDVQSVEVRVVQDEGWLPQS